jgi:cardiolipin synthase (CMP-forming)
MPLNVPILLTWLRILTIPLVIGVFYVPEVWLSSWHQNLIATSLFIAAAITDWLDGYLARRLNQTSAFGAFLDPVADKLLLTSAFVTLTYLKVIPFWIAVVVVSRDLVLSVGVLVIHVAGGTVQPAPSWLGKLSTVFQMATVLAAMTSFYFGTLQALPRLLAWVTAAFTVTSGLQYIIQGLKQINPPAGVSARG